MSTRNTFATSQQQNGNRGDQNRGEQGRGEQNRGQQGQGGSQEGQAGVMGQLSSAGEAVQSQAQHYVEDYPISTVLAVFGIGLGVGAVLGSSLLASMSRSSSDWESTASDYLPAGASRWAPDTSSWTPANAQAWFQNHAPNVGSWGNSLMRGARNMMHCN